MKTAITTTLSKQFYDYLFKEAKNEGVPLNAILERALRLYRKWRLVQEVDEGMEERREEYLDVAGEFESLHALRLKNL